MIKAPKDQEGPYGIPAALVGVYPPPGRIWCNKMLKRCSHLPDCRVGEYPPPETPGAKVALVAYQDRSPKGEAGYHVRFLNLSP